MKLLTVDRGHAKLEDGDKYVLIEGEMLFLDNATKMGYTLYLYTIKNWRTPTGFVPVDSDDRARIINFLQSISEKNEPYLDLVFDP